MRVFVVGATGALGRPTVARLLSEGHEVTAVGRSTSQLRHLAGIGATPAAIDLFDAAAIVSAMRGHDAVINVATRVPSPGRMLLPGAWRRCSAFAVKVPPSSPMRRSRRASCGSSRSFAPIYPDCGGEWITERTPIAPAQYVRTAADAEDAASRLGTKGGIAVILRFGMLYSGGDVFADQVIATIRKGWSPFIGKPDGYLPLVTHDDAAAAAVAALNVPAGIYNVVDNEPSTRGALANDIAGMLGTRPPRFLPSWIAALAGSMGDTLSRSLRISNQKLRAASNWSPSAPSAREGFKRIIEASR